MKSLVGIVVLCVAASLGSGAVQAADVYVAPEGDDAWSAGSARLTLRLL